MKVSRMLYVVLFFFSSRRRHTRCSRDWSSDVCSSDLLSPGVRVGRGRRRARRTAPPSSGGTARSSGPPLPWGGGTGEHTFELQSPVQVGGRLLVLKKKRVVSDEEAELSARACSGTSTL